MDNYPSAQPFTKGIWVILGLFIVVLGRAFFVRPPQTQTTFLLAVLAGIFFLAWGLLPLLPSTQQTIIREAFFPVNHILGSMLGVIIILLAFAMVFGWSAEMRWIIIRSGGGVCIAVIVFYSLRWIIRTIRR